MGKKKNSMSLLYLIGMIAVVVGCFLPIIEVKLGPLGSIKTNVIRAFQSLESAKSWLQLLMFVAAMVGADLLILMSDIDGLYTDDPNKNKDAKLLKIFNLQYIFH